VAKKELWHEELSDQLWRRNFGADPAIVKQAIALNGQKYTVVGVMPTEVASLYRSIQMWSPLVFSEKVCAFSWLTLFVLLCGLV